MEPMTLGSPSNSPSPGTNAFLPAFLMGESNVPTTPRNNTLSPTKGRTMAFAQSPRNTPGPSSPSDFSRSVLQQKTLFGYHQTPTSHNFSANAQMNHNSSTAGPPTQGLFDSLQAEKNFVDSTSNASFNQTQGGTVRPLTGMGFNQSIQFNQSLNESYLNQSDFNTSRITSPIQNYDYQRNANNLSSAQYNDCLSPRPHSNFWITVFGFPQSASQMILSHFSQCGTIVDRIFPAQNGNWVHLKFSSRLECDKALNYHERIVANCLMIGVTYCKDPVVVDKENSERSNLPVNRVRPLTHIAYKNAQTPTEVAVSPTAPKRSAGIVNKAMDMIFGW